MQVNLTSTAGPARPADDSRHLLLPELLQLLRGDPTTQARHQRQSEQRERDLREKDADYREAVAEATSGNRPSDRIARAERKMLPGSQAARRELMRDKAARRASEGRGDFQRALTDAAGRGKGGPSGPATQPANETAREGKSATADLLQDNADKPAKPTPTAGQQSNTPAANAKATSGNTNVGPAAAARLASFAAASSSALVREGLPAGRSDRSVGRVSSVSAAAGAKASAGAAGTSRPGGGPSVAVAATAESNSTRQGRLAGAKTVESEPVSKNDTNIERIVRLLRLRIGKDRSVATLRLDPPELGKIRLHMDLRHDRLTLQVETQTVAARRLLGEQLDTLRRNLEASGIHLERVEIRSPEPTNSPPEAHNQQRGVLGDHDQQSAHSDAESAGGGQDWEPESPPAELARDEARDSTHGPAAESLVNVLA